MLPRTISASSIQTFEACPARYKAENIDRIPQTSGKAAALGTVVHAALEKYITDGLHLAGGTVADLHAYLEEAWWDEFYEMDDKMYSDGKDMLARWWDRNQDWSYREVVMAEVKERFALTLPGRDPIPVTYIWDRCDRDIHTGDINVVDYKTYGSPLPIDALKERIQPRLYALGAYIRFKDEDFEKIWVTYDMLRYEEISVAFTRDECVTTWRYLQRVAERILASDGTEETLNDTCRWCVRQAVCETLQKHAAGGGMLGITDLEEAIIHRARADSAAKALYGQRDELDAFIIEQFEMQMISPQDGIEVGGYKATVGGRGKRVVAADRVAEIIGPELMARYGSMTVSKVDELLKTDSLTPEQKKEVKKHIRKAPPSKLTVTTKAITEYEEK